MFLCYEIHDKSLMTTMKKLLFCISTRTFGDDGKEHIIAIIGSSQWEGQLKFDDIRVQMRNSMTIFITNCYCRLK